MATINSILTIALQVRTYCTAISGLERFFKKPERKNEKETMTISVATKSRKMLLFLQKQVDIVSYLT